MSDDYHRPTYTAPQNTMQNSLGAYNATQVRLYGIPGLLGNKEREAKAKPIDVITARDDNIALAVIGRTKTGSNNNSTLSEKITKFLGLELTPSSWVFMHTKIRKFMIMLGAIDLDKDDDQKLTSGVIFGYAYEGHCYDLPKPKIMLIPTEPEDIPKDDCGYDRKNDANYRVWIVDKLDECMELDMNQGFIEQIVLDANLPGKRSPSMYAAKFQMAHRSGRLSE